MIKKQEAVSLRAALDKTSKENKSLKTRIKELEEEEEEDEQAVVEEERASKRTRSGKESDKQANVDPKKSSTSTG